MCYFAPEGFSEEKISIMRALGADIKRTPKDEGVIGAQTKSKKLRPRIRGSIYEPI